MRDWQAYVRAQLALPDLMPAREARIVRELAAALEDCYREARARGAAPDEADAFARVQITDWARLADDIRCADRPHLRPRGDRVADRLDRLARTHHGGFTLMAQMWRDARLALRQMRQAPGYSLVVILTLALGIGATSAIFSVVNGVILRPLPYPEPDRLMRIYEVVPQYGRFSVAPATFVDWQRQSTAFEGIAAYNPTIYLAFVGPDGPERLPGAAVGAGLFGVLGVAPEHGRGFSSDEDLPGAAPVAVISHGLWQRRFGGDPGVVGRGITLNGRSITVVGIMPPGFHFPSRAVELWMPLALPAANLPRGAHYLGVIARVRPGTTAAQADAEMKTIANRIGQQEPQFATESAEVVPLHDQIVGQVRPALLTLFAAVGVVVLIACANVANLLLVRASVREREMAIRAALGAGRRRIVLQVLAESVVLAGAGGVIGLLLAYLAIPAVQQLGASSIPRVDDVAIDPRVLAFAAATTVLTGLIFGSVPAWHAGRHTLGAQLKEGGRGTAGSGGRRVRQALLVGEVALSIVLLAGAALLLRSFSRLTSVEPGFDADRVLAFQVAVPQAKYPQPAQRAHAFETLLAALEAHPQITSAGLVQTLPMRGTYTLAVTIDGRPPLPPGEGLSANYRVATPQYFRTLGIPLLRGRVFTDRDRDGAPLVAVVDQAFAARHFPGEEAIGRRIDIGNNTDGFYEIVGVVGDVHHSGLDAEAAPTMYVPYRQDVFSTMWVVARTEGNPADIAAAARQALKEVDPTIPAALLSPMRDVLSDTLAQPRFSMLLLSVFAAIALFLASVGLYGVVSYTVSQRTQEIGLRMAIGAQPWHVLRLVIGGGMSLALVGVVIGTAGALALSELLASMLFGITRFDAPSYAATALVLLSVALIACYVPARRAMRVDPVLALRQD